MATTPVSDHRQSRPEERPTMRGDGTGEGKRMAEAGDHAEKSMGEATEGEGDRFQTRLALGYVKGDDEMPEDPATTRPHARETRVGPSKTRLTLAFLVAAASDVVSYGTEFVPPVQWVVDVVTALLLFVLLGWRWALLPGLVAEAIPGVAAFPVWVLVVASVALWGGIKRTTPRPGVEETDGAGGTRKEGP